MKFRSQKDEILKQKIIEVGFDPEDLLFLKNNFERRIYENDKEYEHFFIGNKRIVSFKMTPDISWKDNEMIIQSHYY